MREAWTTCAPRRPTSGNTNDWKHSPMLHPSRSCRPPSPASALNSREAPSARTPKPARKAIPPRALKNLRRRIHLLSSRATRALPMDSSESRKMQDSIYPQIHCHKLRLAGGASGCAQERALVARQSTHRAVRDRKSTLTELLRSPTWRWQSATRLAGRRLCHRTPHRRCER